MEFDQTSLITSTLVIAPILLATDTTTAGAIVDTGEFQSLTYCVYTGVVADGDYTLLFEESDASNMSGSNVVATADLIGGGANLGPVLAADDGATIRIGVVAKKQFQRLSLVSDNTSTGAFICAYAIQGHPRNAPVTAQGTAA